MAEERRRPLLGKVIIQGSIVCITGLHIGSPRDNLDIGGVDSPVLRNPMSREPYIPGSSLKGKLRSLFERSSDKEFNRGYTIGGQSIRHHECTDVECSVCRLFGATADRRDEGGNIPARLFVRDGFLTPESLELLHSIDTGLQYTELKFENTLDRVTAAANPRQIERIPAGAEFAFEMIYNVESRRQQEIQQDLVHLFETMSLLEDDALGGHGSRGYGKIRFRLTRLMSRSMAFYQAVTSIERERASVLCPVQTVQAGNEKLSEVLSIFS